MFPCQFVRLRTAIDLATGAGSAMRTTSAGVSTGTLELRSPFKGRGASRAKSMAATATARDTDTATVTTDASNGMATPRREPRSRLVATNPSPTPTARATSRSIGPSTRMPGRQGGSLSTAWSWLKCSAVHWLRMRWFITRTASGMTTDQGTLSFGLDLIPTGSGLRMSWSGRGNSLLATASFPMGEAG